MSTGAGFDDESVPKIAMERIRNAVAPFMNMELVPRVVEMLMESAAAESTRLRLAGFRFPDLVAVVLERRGFVGLFRRDLSGDNIKRVVSNLVRLYPSLDMMEVAVAIHRAWPDHKPDDTGAAAHRAKIGIELKKKWRKPMIENVTAQGGEV